MAEITREDILKAMEASENDRDRTYQDQTVIAAASAISSLLIDIRERLDKIIEPGNKL